MKKSKKNLNANKKQKDQNEYENQILKIRKYQLEEIKFAIKKYDNIAVTGTFGSGKTFLKEQWIKNKENTEDYLEINAYLFKDEDMLITNLIKDLIINKKMKYKKIWPNINSWFGKMVYSFKVFWSIFLSILISSLFSSLFAFYELNIFSLSMFLYLLLIPGLLSFFSITFIILYLNIRFNELKNYEKLYSYNQDINYLIIIVEDLNRLTEVEQKKFMQILSICIEKLNKNNLNFQFKVKTLILNDFQNKKENSNIEFEWNKYIDYDVVINNDQKNMRDIFNEILISENINLFNIISKENRQKIDQILELIFQQEDIRLVKLFIEKINYYLNQYNDLFGIKINFVDLFSYIYLSVFHEAIFKYINHKPNIIAYNSVLPNSLNFNYDEHWAKLITKESKSEKLWEYEIIKPELLPLTEGILRKQKSNLNADNPMNNIDLNFIMDDYESPNKDIIDITELNFFYFFKFPTNLKKFVEYALKAAKEIEQHFAEDNFFIIQSLLDYIKNYIKEIYYYGNKTIELFLKLTFKLIKIDKNQLFLKIKESLINFYSSFSKIKDVAKIREFINFFKNEFKEEIFSDIGNILEKNKFYHFNSKDCSFLIKIKTEKEKKDIWWLLISSEMLRYEFLQISKILYDENQQIRKNVADALNDKINSNEKRKLEVCRVMKHFNIVNILYKKVNNQDLLKKSLIMKERII